MKTNKQIKRMIASVVQDKSCIGLCYWEDGELVVDGMGDFEGVCRIQFKPVSIKASEE